MSKHRLYFIVPASRRQVKIGMSANPWTRLYDLQAGNHEKLSIDLLLTFPDRSSAWRYEDAMHQQFAAQWLHREWFTYSSELQAFCRTWKEGGRPSISQPPCSIKQAISCSGYQISRDDFLANLRARAIA
ncbi:hypothetical protein SAMIE_1015340 [Sphingobium amiense]|uniref:Bacteriophage T5 Orf172 DNA-binding domain-containing protein n=1 Tax=Sphingobium amiense TaxID=135719 RepID=A0A494W039_9SPHN|nr:GIY-YIG nuclease family protein [Sphingobium amiense]BBD98033.1 hypothetical protein SAMIE_1015340 [Sphingobium amiense]